MAATIEALVEWLKHILNWIAALFVLALTCPQYEHIAGLVAFPLAVMALGCAFLIASLSLMQGEQ